MSVSKPLLTATSIAIAAIFGGGVYFMVNLGSLAEQVTERIASQALGVAVQIEEMDVSLQERSVTVQGITVANPPGFQNNHALSIEKVRVSLEAVSKALITFGESSAKKRTARQRGITTTIPELVAIPRR